MLLLLMLLSPFAVDRAACEWQRVDRAARVRRRSAKTEAI